MIDISYFVRKIVIFAKQRITENIWTTTLKM